MTTISDLMVYLSEWADDFEAAARDLQSGKYEHAKLKSTVLATRAEECRKILNRFEQERARYKEDTIRIEINFPVMVNIENRDFHGLVNIVAGICEKYEERHLGRVMWPAGMGSKITYMPMTREEEQAGKHMEFDATTLSIDCCEREDFDWKCKKCGLKQGDHKGLILDPPAKDCDFEPTETKNA